MGSPYVGEIRMFAGTFAPVGWAFCDGSLLSIAENEVLFVLIGTTYGGDGQTTFQLPDLRGRVPMHWGQGQGLSNRLLGEYGGTESVTLTAAQLPVHTHPVLAQTGIGTQASPAGGVWAVSPVSTAPLYSAGPPATAMNAGAIAPSGGSQPHDNMIPFQAVNFIISLYGIFPSQN
jgi:microcystin-dependent protein